MQLQSNREPAREPASPRARKSHHFPLVPYVQYEYRRGKYNTAPRGAASSLSLRATARSGTPDASSGQWTLLLREIAP
eukprot:COSAG02_NODE_5805_length_4024_cov_3.059873_4_plen_78_part_00